MKKQFLTIALLATVAVGAAFAGNANLSTVSITHGSPYNDNGNCETPTIVRPGQNCDVQPSLYRCTLLIGGDAYVENPETGLCTRALYQQ